MTVVLSNTPVLETERLILRAPGPEDFAPFAGYYASDRARASGWEGDAAQTFAFFTQILGHWVLRGFGWFVLCRRSGGQPIGTCGVAWPLRFPEPELAWTLWSAADEGRGLAFEAASAARDHARAHLALASLVSYVAASNARSEALARRLGASIDPAAEVPEFDTAEKVRAFRHPLPGGSA